MHIVNDSIILSYLFSDCVCVLIIHCKYPIAHHRIDMHLNTLFTYLGMFERKKRLYLTMLCHYVIIGSANAYYLSTPTTPILTSSLLMRETCLTDAQNKK